MNRFRRKSDARRRSFKGESARMSEGGEAKSTTAKDGSTTPAGEPPKVDLPGMDDFRTSLILPNLMRRFSLLRGRDGQLVDLKTMQDHLDLQRQTGRLTTYEVDAVLEQYRLQAGRESARRAAPPPKRERIDWSTIEDEDAFLDSLSLASVPSADSRGGGSARTSLSASHDDARSLHSSASRPPVPPFPDLSSFSATSSTLGLSPDGNSALSPSSVPLSREPSSSANSQASSSQGYPYRVKKGTNSLFGGRTHDARDLRMLRSSSAQSISSNRAPSARDPSVVEEPSALESTTTDEDGAGIASAPQPQDRDDRRLPGAANSAEGDSAAGNEDRPELAAAGREHAIGADPASAPEVAVPKTPTTPLTAKQLHRISNALDAIEVELGKTFTRMSWTSEEEDEEEALGDARDPEDPYGCTAEPEQEQPVVQFDDAPRQPGDRSRSASPRRPASVLNSAPGGVLDERPIPPIPAAQPRLAENSSIGVASSDQQFFELVGPASETVPPSPISPITESDLRGVNTFDSPAAQGFDNIPDASPEPSDTEELDPLFSRDPPPPKKAVSALPLFGGPRIPSAIVIPPRATHSAILEMDTVDEGPRDEEAQRDASQAVGGTTALEERSDEALPAATAKPGEDRPDEAAASFKEGNTSSYPAQSGADLGAAHDVVPPRESLETLRTEGSSCHIHDSTRSYSDEEAEWTTTAPSSLDQHAPNSADADEKLRAVPETPSALRPTSEAMDRRSTNELLEMIGSPGARASSYEAGDDSMLTREDVLAIQKRLVQSAALRNCSPAADGATGGTYAAPNVLATPVTPGSARVMGLNGESQETLRDDAVDGTSQRLSGLGLDDFAATDFTQPSPQQVDAARFPSRSGTEAETPSQSEKPSPSSFLSPTSAAMTAQNSQQTYGSTRTPSSVLSASTSSPSDAFEYSSLVASPIDPRDLSSPTAGTVNGIPGATVLESSPLSEQSHEGTSPVVVDEDAGANAHDTELQTTETTPSIAEAAAELLGAATLPQPLSTEQPTVTPRLGIPRNRSHATSMLVRDVEKQAKLATTALKEPKPASPSARPLRKSRSIRKQSISVPQLVSGPIKIPAVPIAAPEILPNRQSDRSPNSSPQRSRDRSSSDAAKTKGIGSRFKRLLSKRENGRSPGDDHRVSAGGSPVRPRRPDEAPVTPPEQATAKFSATLGSPQTPSTVVTLSPKGSTPRSSPRKIPASTVFPTKRSSIAQSARPPVRASAMDGTEDASDTNEAQDAGHASALARAYSPVAPLSPRRGFDRSDSTQSRGLDEVSASDALPRRTHIPRDSVESMLRFRQAAEGLGLDPDKVQELVNSAYAGSPTASSHARHESIGSSAGGHSTVDHQTQWSRGREASHGSETTAGLDHYTQSVRTHDCGHARQSTGFAQADGLETVADRHLSSASSRFADPVSTKFPSLLLAPAARLGSQPDSLAPPRSSGVESDRSRQSSSATSDYAASFLDYYAHEGGETDNEGPFNLSTGSTFDPSGDGRVSEGGTRSARVSGAPSGEVVWQVLDDLRTNRFSVASHASSFGFGSHSSSNGLDDLSPTEPNMPVSALLRHRDRKRSSASLAPEWDNRFPSIYLREEQALIELGEQGGVAFDESGRFLVRPKASMPEVPPVPEQYRDQVEPPLFAEGPVPDTTASATAEETRPLRSS